MTSSLYPPPRPLAVGETLDLAFRIFRATLLSCLVYSGLAVIAGELPNIYNIARQRPLATLLREHDPVFWLLYVAGTIIAVVLCSALLLRQHAIASGGRPATGSELPLVLRRLPGLVLLVVLCALATGVWFVPLLALGGSGILTQGLAVVLLSIPATWVGVALSCAGTVFLISGAGAVASLTRSWRLVRGNWWRLTAIYTVGVLLLFVLLTIAGALALIVAVPVARGDLAVLSAVTTVVVVILNAIGLPFFIALALAAYGDLAVRREGADLAQKIAAAG
ncbi:MAG: hypothetical protein ACLPQ6_08285 [Steroidobacteraceae bacterium]|jgi:hypothetical protein